MKRDFSFYADGNDTELIKRYERYLNGKDNGYFDAEEIAQIIDYYLFRDQTHQSLQALKFGKKLHPNSNILDVKNAKINLSLGRIKEAYQIISEMIESDEEIILLKIELFLKMSMKKEANQLVYRILTNELEEKDVIADDIAIIFMGENLYADAIKWLNIGLEFNPKNSILLLDLAFCHEQIDNPKEALIIYEKAINTDPYNSSAWFNKGALYFKQEDFGKALECFDFATTIDENDELALLYKAHSLYQIKKWKEAKEHYMMLENSWLEKWQIDFFIADCLENLDQTEEALEYYFKSEKEMPNHYETLTGIAYCFLTLEEYQNALIYLDKAIKIDSELPDAWAYIGEVLMELEMYKEALIVFDKAISIEPMQSDVLLSMATICVELENFALAKKYYELTYQIDNSVENIELMIATVAFYTEEYKDMLYYLQLAENKDLNATKKFLEMCPNAEKILKK
ncbi:MAG: hypothetical protein CR965_00295 [Paludibacter sp.]|nr:MAG: hypothetical protein CR965_00295 [Paludibacter sp.]